MNSSPPAGDEFDRRLRRGGVLRLSLDTSILDDPALDTRSKYVIVLSALLPDEHVWFVMCTSKTQHFDNNRQFERDILRWVAGEYAWCRATTTIVDCTKAFRLPSTRMRELHAAGQLEFCGDIRPNHLAKIDGITKASRFLSPEEKRWIVPWD